ncbi:MAG: DEAD/DEAH box helicase [Alphaproteobacteria bacterium]|nr:DEAD/DEAH box helicase [Alphaproteobacteria bacterium]
MSPFERAQPALATALDKRGYTTFTPVQSAVLDEQLHSEDLLVSAQTGSGKTVAFGLAVAGSILPDDGRMEKSASPLALVIAPTRELALQVKSELEWLYAETGAQVSSCVGGMDPRTERRALSRGVQIVVGTPGRLRDHITRGALDLRLARAVVLDEADEMLDLGFREDLEFILDAAPRERRTLMFSATLPREVTALAKRFQNQSKRISVDTERSHHADIDYIGYEVLPRERENAIINILRYHDAPGSIVFCGTRETVKRMTSRLANRGFSTVALSGEFSQSERTHALQSMRDGRSRICVATDVASRGIDLPQLDLVVHADLPNDAQTLLHRSGRTGRAGRKGVCALVATTTKRRNAERLARNAKVNIRWQSAPNSADIRALDRQRIIDNAFLQGQADEEETDFAKTLLTSYSAEQIATAFLRQCQAALPAPEELTELSQNSKTQKRARSDFEGGTWFAINAGRKQRAEPRWLLPVICRSGGIDKRSVGSIIIGDGETQFEIDPATSESFRKTIEEHGCVERSLHIRPIGEPSQSPGPSSDETPSGKGRPVRAKRKHPRSGKNAGGEFKGTKPRKKMRAVAGKNKGKRKPKTP